MQGRLAVLVTVLVAVVLAPAAAGAATRPHAADGRLSDWRGTPGAFAGLARLSRGELIYTDYLYDDYGPDLNGAPDRTAFRGNLAPTSGDYRYPADEARYGHNAADLRELRLTADRRALHVLVALQTMRVADAAITTLAIDLDGNRATGAAAWPDGSGLSTPGAERFLVVVGSRARVLDRSGRVLARPRAAVNLKENAIEVTLPFSSLGRPARVISTWAAVGLADGERFAAQEPGRPAAFDAAFTGEDDAYGLGSHWGDGRQSRVLASGDLSPFRLDASPGTLRKGGTRPLRIRPGFHNRIFRSRFTYGEGVALKDDGGLAGTADPQFKGRHQPYGVWIPRDWRAGRPTPLLLAGHSLDVNHNEYIAVPPRGNFYRQLGDERSSLVITPLARGMDTWYLDAGFGDVMEAWADARRTFGADDERTSITGYSMGGYMTYRLGLLMPDRFVAASSYVGPPAYYVWPYPLPVQTEPHWRVRGNTNMIVGNGLNLPFEIVHGNGDQLVPVSGVQQQADTFRARGNPYRFDRHLADDHFSFIVNDEWGRTRDWLGTGRRTLSPVTVRYRRYPVMDLPRHGLTFDGAYWVDGLDIRPGGEDAFGEIEATTLALGGARSQPVAEGPAPVTAGGVSPGTRVGQRLVAGEPIRRANAFEARFTNLRGARLVTRRMGLDTARPVTASLTGDGALVLRLDGRWPARVRATLDGAPVAVRRERRGLALTLTLAAGRTHRLELR